MLSGQKRLAQLKSQGLTTTEIDRLVFTQIAIESSRNVAVFGLLGIILLAVGWGLLLWVSLSLFGFLAIANFVRVMTGLIGDVVSIFSIQEHAHWHQFLTTGVLFLETCVYATIAVLSFIAL